MTGSLRRLAREEVEASIQGKVDASEVELKVENAVKLVVAQIKDVEERVTEAEASVAAVPTDYGTVTIDGVRTMVREAIAMYDADKTGLPDFALEPAGGTVINTRCSETYDSYGIQYKIAGIPVWSTSVSPRAVIQPRISPGECWAFRGAEGRLVIKLSQLIIPTAFSYEHIPKQISRDGNIDSAPLKFQVRGLADELDTEGHLLGNYEYLDNDVPLQRFDVQDPNPKPYQFVELVVLSNQGHPEYTCLYRFRVHGKRTRF
jgi:SUN domain-containing protein 1/2